MTKYVVDLPDNVSFIVGKGYVLFNEKEFLRIPVKQLEKYSKKEDVEVEKDEEIVFDGRKEEHMSEKYVVSQVFMNELKEWKHDLILEDAFFVNQEAINNMPKIIKNWWVDDYETIGESNKRLISIIRYMSGANDFEVEKPKKWVVRSKDRTEQGSYLYIYLIDSNGVKDVMTGFTKDIATKFDTKEEADSWANSHQEVVQVEVEE